MRQRDFALPVCAFALSLIALIVKELDGEMGSHDLHCVCLLHALAFALAATRLPPLKRPIFSCLAAQRRMNIVERSSKGTL